MEGLEKRELLAANPVLVPLPAVDAALFADMQPRNIGAVQATAFSESENAQARGLNDTIFTADLVPLGTQPGQNKTYDVTGTIGIELTPQGTFLTDIDTFALDLQAGDILDLAVLGAGANLTVLYEDGRIWWGTDLNTATGTYPAGSPLQNLGNAVGAQVVPTNGRYYVSVAPSAVSLNYTLGMRAYRPLLEQTSIGAQQVLFLDFDGGIYPTSDFAPPPAVPLGIVRVLGLEDSLDVLGFVNPGPGTSDRIIDYIIQETEEQLATIAANGTNGDYDATGTPGDYGILVLNSRDHVDPGNHPLVTRVVIGSEVGQPITGLFGIAQTIDVGNFQPDEKVLVQLETHAAAVQQYPISPSSSFADAIAQQMAATITHEAVHSFGMWHTDGNNTVENLIDEGSQSLDDYAQGIGNDGIFGTADDVTPGFNDDRFSLTEAQFFGIERVPAGLSHVLSTGTVGSTVSGRAFNDLNGNGSSTLDPGLAGVTVYADINGDGIQSPTDPSVITGSGGTFTLITPPGTFNVIGIAPTQFAATTTTSILTTVSLGAAASGIEFGFNQVVADITGTKFSDNNGNGLFDPSEPGIGGVYIYLDLDGDNRPDLGEPASISGPDGSYSINFPGPGTYTIREVVEPGFIQTFPASGEHIVTFDGVALTNNFNFGNLPSRDFGDAPDTYRTSIATGGPNHGITTGLTIGTVVDRELNGQSTANATGDDVNGRVNFDGSIQDDEDGVRLLSPLGPGDSAAFQVTLTNTTGSPGYLSAWMDFNTDGDFDDPGEKFATDLVRGTGVHTIPVLVPATATIGTSFTRFRYSLTPGLGVGGDADTGEVEDYSFPILDAARVANNDEFSVSRNTQANQLDVLRNDFQTIDNQLTIVGRDISTIKGTIVIAADGRSIFYTPPTGFIGRDVFGYTVRDQFGITSSATVVVNVTFQSAIPIALDDTFEIPEGSVNRALNVLDNDIASTAGGLSITSVTAGNQGGTINVVGGGQSIRYTPLPGFNGTEQFTYNIQDAVGSISSATVTVNLLPGSRSDDIVRFSIEFFDVENDEPVTHRQVGQFFNVRVFVDDLRTVSFGDPEGVASAFLDLLYTDELVATVDSDGNPNFPFDISFGPLFSGGGVFQTGSAQIPGLYNEIGAVQPIESIQTHSGPVELLTLTMQAVSPGVAIFQADPADALVSETTIVGSDRALEVKELRLGRSELTISPAQANFASAIDDSFPDSLDSDGFLIANDAATIARLDVLDNDNFGPTGTITEFGLVTAASFGDATVNRNGTPGFFADDFIEYVGDLNANGFEQFTYVTVSADGIRSTAKVTFPIGNAGANDLVSIEFATVNGDGSANPTGTYGIGDKVGLQVIVEDIRGGLDVSYVFAGFLDIMYDFGILNPANTITTDDFRFDVVFGSDFNPNAAVGTSARRGIIDEFGTLLIQSIAEAGNVDNPNLMATIYFDAVAAGTTIVAGGPADNSPFQDTLLFRENDLVPVDQIRYDTTKITVLGGPEPESLHNFVNPSDVNNDGHTSPIDALLVMNFLNTRQAEGEILASDYFHDVTGEGKVTSLDALRVMNDILEARNASEAEFVVNSPNAATASSNPAARASDEALATLEDSPIVGGTAENQNGVGAVITTTANGDDSDDDEDDVLGLLADDVSGLWS